MLKTGAGRLAEREVVPTSLRAVLGYYAETGVFDWGSLRLKRRVDATTEAMIGETFARIEAEIAGEFGHDFVAFEYDTKLILPAKLTLGYLYRHLDDSERRRAETLTRLAIEALVDGDMRDAINDEEYEDFEVDFPTDTADRRRIAEIAQQTLEDRVRAGFADYPESVREAYDWAVGVSEAHQDDDARFRDLMATASGESAGDPERARQQIREEYKYATFEEPPALFETAELDLPYLKTQYDRVGVIYDGMIEMYCRAGLPVEDAFRKSIVLAIIGAQVWLDDVDDYAADMRAGQLTPVTAEYLLAETDGQAHESTVEIAREYLDLATEYATAVDSPLTGIATEYIYRSGDPGVLPDGG